MTAEGLQVHVIGSRQMGGAERFYQRLVEAMAARGHGVVAVCRPNSPLRGALAPGIPVRTAPMANGWDLYSVLRLRRLVRESGPAVVQTYMGRATRLTRLPGGGGAVHVARLGGYYKVKGYYGHADAWIGNTRGLCDYLIGEGLPRDRVYWVGNFVDAGAPGGTEDASGLRDRLGIPPEALVVFSLGRLIPIKGFDTLLAAFERLPGKIAGRPVFLVLAGDGPLRQRLEASTRGGAVEGRVIWTGWVGDPSRHFGLGDLLVCPSRRETLGNVILEGWAHRLPVIATETPGARELIRDGVNGLLTPIGDAARLSRRMEALLGAPAAERAALGEAGHAEVVRHHTEEKVLSRYLEVYAEVRRKAGR